MTETIPPCGAAALDYVNRGLAVIPVAPGGKVPMLTNGINGWTDNPEMVEIWWGFNGNFHEGISNPNFNVGIVCGQCSGGVIVIDVDAHGDVDGRETLKTWQIENGDLPETVTQITGGGGLQLFYRVDRKIDPSVNGELGIDILMQRLASGEVKELILATNPTVEGDATASYIAALAKRHNISVSKLASGVPLGGDLDNIDEQTIAASLAHRRPY